MADLLTTALEVAAAVANAFPPPWGRVSSSSITAIGDILSYFFGTSSGSQPSPTLQEILTALDQTFTRQDIETATNDITQVVQTFDSATDPDQVIPPNVPPPPGPTYPLPSNINQELTTNPDSPFSKLYNMLNAAIFGSQDYPVVPGIISMSTTTQGDICPADSNLQAAYLPTFAFGVSTYLLLTNYLISLAYSVGGTAAIADTNINTAYNNLAVTPFLGTPGGWIQYASSAISPFESLVEARLQQISAFPYSQPDDTPPWEEVYAVCLSDSGEPVDNFDPSGLGANLDNGWVAWPGNVSTSWPNNAQNVVFCAASDNSQADTNAIQALYSQYVDLMRSTIYVNYFDPGKMSSLIQAWNAGVSKLSSSEQG